MIYQFLRFFTTHHPPHVLNEVVLESVKFISVFFRKLLDTVSGRS